MNKQQLALLALLKTKFAGVADAILEKIATKKGANITDEQVNSIAEGISFQNIIDSHADSRVNEATASAVANYEKKHGIKDGKAVGGGKQEDKKEPEEDAPEWAKSIIDTNKALQDKIAQMEGEKTAGSRKSQLIEAINGTSEVFKARYQKDFDRMNFKDDADFAEWLEDAKKDAVNFKQQDINDAVAGKREYKEKTEEEYKKMFENSEDADNTPAGAVKLDI